MGESSLDLGRLSMARERVDLDIRYSEFRCLWHNTIPTEVCEVVEWYRRKIVIVDGDGGNGEVWPALVTGVHGTDTECHSEGEIDGDERPWYPDRVAMPY
jgi:hypothetical protein